MTLKNASIGIASLALALGPAIAQASPTGHGKPEGSPGKGPTQRSESGSQHSGGAENQGKNQGETQPTKSKKCSTHMVAYVASGTLVSDTLTKSEKGNTYSGSVVVEVTQTNRHGRPARGTSQTYTVTEARVRGLAVTSLAKGDRVKLIGKISSVAPKCETSTSTPTITITKLVFHAPRASTKASS